MNDLVEEVVNGTAADMVGVFPEGSVVVIHSSLDMIAQLAFARFYAVVMENTEAAGAIVKRAGKERSAMFDLMNARCLTAVGKAIALQGNACVSRAGLVAIVSFEIVRTASAQVMAPAPRASASVRLVGLGTVVRRGTTRSSAVYLTVPAMAVSTSTLGLASAPTIGLGSTVTSRCAALTVAPMGLARVTPVAVTRAGQVQLALAAPAATDVKTMDSAPMAPVSVSKGGMESTVLWMGAGTAVTVTGIVTWIKMENTLVSAGPVGAGSIATRSRRTTVRMALTMMEMASLTAAIATAVLSQRAEKTSCAFTLPTPSMCFSENHLLRLLRRSFRRSVS